MGHVHTILDPGFFMCPPNIHNVIRTFYTLSVVVVKIDRNNLRAVLKPKGTAFS